VHVMAAEAMRRILAPCGHPGGNHGRNAGSGDQCRVPARRSQSVRPWLVGGRATPHADAEKHGAEPAGGKPYIRAPRVRSPPGKTKTNASYSQGCLRNRTPARPDSQSNTPPQAQIVLACAGSLNSTPGLL